MNNAIKNSSAIKISGATKIIHEQVINNNAPLPSYYVYTQPSNGFSVQQLIQAQCSPAASVSCDLLELLKARASAMQKAPLQKRRVAHAYIAARDQQKSDASRAAAAAIELDSTSS